jgi:hypothetical protein
MSSSLPLASSKQQAADQTSPLPEKIAIRDVTSMSGSKLSARTNSAAARTTDDPSPVEDGSWCERELCPQQGTTLRVVLPLAQGGGGALLEVPPGSVVSAGVRVRLSVHAAHDAALASVGPLIMLLPHGLQLLQPATLTLLLPPEVADANVVLVTRPGADVAQPHSHVPAWRLCDEESCVWGLGGARTVRIQHFSLFRAMHALAAHVHLTYPRVICRDAAHEERRLGIRVMLNTQQHPPPVHAAVGDDALPVDWQHARFNVMLPRGCSCTLELHATAAGSRVMCQPLALTLLQVPPAESAARPPQPLLDIRPMLSPSWAAVAAGGEKVTLSIRRSCAPGLLGCVFSPAEDIGAVDLRFDTPETGRGVPPILMAPQAEPSPLAARQAVATPLVVQTNLLCKVAVSYVVRESGARGDGFVLRLKEALQAVGYRTFVCEAEIHVGQGFDDLIAENFDQCAAAVLVISPSYGDAVLSPYSLQEAKFVDRLNKTRGGRPLILPVWHSGPWPPKPSVIRFLLAGHDQYAPAGPSSLTELRDGGDGDAEARVIRELLARLRVEGVTPTLPQR